MDPQLEIRKLLQGEFTRLRAKNSAYSLRAFARYLGVVPSALSEILNSERSITKKMGQRILMRLTISPTQYQEILNSLQDKTTRSSAEFLLMDMDQYYIITDWHYYAVLSLMETKKFKEDPHWIAKRLNITVRQAQQALTRLERLEMLVRNPKGELVSSGKQFTTTTDIANSAIRQRHLSNLDLARTSLEKDDVNVRDFSEITMAVDVKNLPKAKELVRKFRRDLCRLMEKGSKEEVYKLCVQLFPLSEKESL